MMTVWLNDLLYRQGGREIDWIELNSLLLITRASAWVSGIEDIILFVHLMSIVCDNYVHICHPLY